ncbi:MAG: glycoside hydrolase family 3 N-terminal domain-containing protein, partial [Cyclobacteriaceae bacterium]
MLKKVLIVFVLWMSFYTVLGQDKKNHWIDSVFQTLSPRDKIGQLFIAQISSYSTPDELGNIIDEIEDSHIGGVLISNGGPVGTSSLLNKLQKISKVPLLVMMEAERGPGTTLDSLISFPPALSLGAIKDDSLLLALGYEIARQMKILGVHVNLGLNADIDVAEMSPFTYFGTDKYSVSRSTASLMRGMQANGVIACAMHTSIPADEDEKLPAYEIDFVANRLDTSSFYPYQQLIDQSVGSILTSNLHFTTLDKKKPIPASISQLFVSDVLKKQLGFKGLTITDSEYFHQLSRKSKSESDKLAFEVGNDLIMNSQNINASIKKIEAALKKNGNLKLQLDNSIKRILAAKYQVGLWQSNFTNTNNLAAKINTPEALILKDKIIEASLTVARNPQNLIPIQHLDGKRFASVSIGTGNAYAFNSQLEKYASFDTYSIANPEDTLQLRDKLREYDAVVLSVFSLAPKEKSLAIQLIHQLETEKVILCSFDNPYALAGLRKAVTTILGYSSEAPVLSQVAQLIFGARQGRGITPVAV